MLVGNAQVGLSIVSPEAATVLVTGLGQDVVASWVRIYYYGFLLSGLALIALGQVARFGSRFTLSWAILVPFVGLAAVSITWSVLPAETLARLIRLSVFTLALISYAQVRGPRNLARAMLIVALALNVFSTLVALALPSIGVHQVTDSLQESQVGNWRGITPQKNILGMYASISALVMLLTPTLVTKSASIRWGLVVACLLNLIMTRSSTSILAFTACLLIYATVLAGRVRWWRTAAGLLGLAAVVVLLVTNLADFAVLSGRDTSLSGRTAIWDYCWQLFLERPVLGYGFGAGTPFAGEKMQVALFPQAVDSHSGYLLILLDLGMVGALAWTGALLGTFWKAVQRLRRSDAAAETDKAMVLILVWALVVAVSETTPFVPIASAGFMTYGAIIAISGRRITARRRPLVTALPARA